MLKLAIRYKGFERHFKPISQSMEIYDHLTEGCQLPHEEAVTITCWAEDAFYEETYETGNPDLEIFFIETNGYWD